MKPIRKASLLEHFQMILIVAAGLIALGLAGSRGSEPNMVRVAHALYGLVFLVGAAAYYLRPRLGAILLIVSLTSLVLAAPLLNLPGWTDGSSASRLGMICGLITSLAIVSQPLFEKHDERRA